MKIDTEKIKKLKSIKELLDFSIINIDKPTGPTSFQISDFISKKLKINKTSHFGTLDPNVTGVLPISLNRACKISGYFLGEDKTYVGIIRFHDKINLDEVNKLIEKKFIGKIKQMPPVRSAVKRELRERTIYEFKLLEQDNLDCLFIARVQGGTYIRTLCVDLGEELKIGAHMLELRRTNAGPFFEDDKKYPSISLYDFEKAVEEYEAGNENKLREILIPAEIIKNKFPTIEIKKEFEKKILNGSPIHNDEVLKKEYLNYENGEKLIAFSENKFIGVFFVNKEKNQFAKPEFTLQEIKS